MPKLLSGEEVAEIAMKMAEEYGLASPNIICNNREESWDSGLRCEIVRAIKLQHDWIPWIKKKSTVKITEFYAQNFEDLLTKLQYELSRFDSRAQIAESFREKYARKEADEALDKVLKDK